MRPAAVVVDSPFLDSHLQMAFVERDEEVEALPSKTAAQPFANRIRLGRSHRRAPDRNALKTLLTRVEAEAAGSCPNADS